MKEIKILDTTLRDGSYAVNFSFSSSDTSTICKKLENCGLEYIEIGHGTGLGSSERGFGKAAHTDEEYMIAAENSLQKSKYGMFCIPGIARLEDLDKCAEHNMGFVRIGTDVTKIEQSEDFIKKAKDYGILVAANYMKSYALEPEKFANKVLLSEKYGADIVYVVDSAGGMFQEDIEKYYNSIRKVSNILLGFHGHDNLGMAIANSIFAAELGFEWVDSSLQGLGRSSGNATTEILTMALIKKGYDIGINFFKLLEVGQNNIQRMIRNKGKMPLDIVAGFADFHSSFMPHILEFSSKYKIDPARLIIEITKMDKVEMDRKALEKIAKELGGISFDYEIRFNPDDYFGGEQDERGTK